MTESTIKTLSARALLNDWMSGMGATGKTPDTWEHVQDGMLHGKTISLSLLTAIAEMKTVGTPGSFDSSIERGYLSKNHLDQHETGKTGKPEVVLKNHVLSPLEHLKSILILALDNLTMTSGEALLSITHAHGLVDDDNYSAGIRHIEEYKLIESEKQTVREQIAFLIAENFLYIRHEGLVISLLSPAGYSNKSIEEALDNSGLVRVAWINHDMEADVKTFTCTAKIKTAKK